MVKITPLWLVSRAHLQEISSYIYIMGKKDDKGFILPLLKLGLHDFRDIKACPKGISYPKGEFIWLWFCSSVDNAVSRLLI